MLLRRPNRLLSCLSVQEQRGELTPHSARLCRITVRYVTSVFGEDVGILVFIFIAASGLGIVYSFEGLAVLTKQ